MANLETFTYISNPINSLRVSAIEYSGSDGGKVDAGSLYRLINKENVGIPYVIYKGKILCLPDNQEASFKKFSEALSKSNLQIKDPEVKDLKFSDEEAPIRRLVREIIALNIRNKHFTVNRKKNGLAIDIKQKLEYGVVRLLLATLSGFTVSNSIFLVFDLVLDMPDNVSSEAFRRIARIKSQERYTQISSLLVEMFGEYNEIEFAIRGNDPIVFKRITWKDSKEDL